MLIRLFIYLFIYIFIYIYIYTYIILISYIDTYRNMYRYILKPFFIIQVFPHLLTNAETYPQEEILNPSARLTKGPNRPREPGGPGNKGPTAQEARTRQPPQGAGARGTDQGTSDRRGGTKAKDQRGQKDQGRGQSQTLVWGAAQYTHKTLTRIIRHRRGLRRTQSLDSARWAYNNIRNTRNIIGKLNMSPLRSEPQNGLSRD